MRCLSEGVLKTVRFAPNAVIPDRLTLDPEAGHLTVGIERRPGCAVPSEHRRHGRCAKAQSYWSSSRLPLQLGSFQVHPEYSVSAPRQRQILHTAFRSTIRPATIDPVALDSPSGQEKVFERLP